MKYLVSLLILLIVSNSWGFAPGFLSTATHMTTVGGGTPTVIAEQPINLGDGSRALNSYTLGNSFTVSTSAPLYSIQLYIDTFIGPQPSGTITCRVDDDTDMSSEYTEQLTLSFPGTSSDTWIEILSSTNSTLTAGTWYFACQSSAAIEAAIEDTSTYSGGQYYYGSYPSWDVSSTVVSRDTVFRISVNQ